MREQLPVSVPMWAVDTACLYPMQLTARAPAKAYIFRSSTDRPRRERITAMPYSSGARNWANLLASCRVRAPWRVSAAKACSLFIVQTRRALLGECAVQH